MLTYHYVATINDNEVRINKVTCGVQINGKEWQHAFKCTLADLKAHAIRMVDENEERAKGVTE